MKKFTLMILCVSTFFIGLGSLVDKVGAKFKSDDKALALIKLARTAIGGDANINNIRSLTVTGKVEHTLNIDGVDKSQEGDFEINLALPDQYIKMMKLKIEDSGTGD